MKYIEVVDADTYFLDRFASDEWTVTPDEKKDQALETATRYIDSLNFVGCKTDDDQELEFPRGDDTEVPESIKIACCEIAFALITGRDAEYELEMYRNQTLTLNNQRLIITPAIVDEAKIHLIPSALAWARLRPYLWDGGSVTLSRVD